METRPKCLFMVLAVIVGQAFNAEAQTVTSLHSVLAAATDGGFPEAALTPGGDGYFYGTTKFGGTSSLGTVFKISPSGAYESIYSFAGSPQEGRAPTAGLVQGSDGSFYGTTERGGTNGSNAGTVFKLTVPLHEPPYPINRITSIRVASADVVLTIPSIAGETYQLQYRNSLGVGGWSNAPSVAPSNSIGGILTLTNFGGVAVSQRFFRFAITP